MYTSFRDWWCLNWHASLERVAKVSAWSDHVRCTKCGREYGMNHDVRAILPWSMVREFYEKR